jgi:hypothetical protein
MPPHEHTVLLKLAEACGEVYRRRFHLLLPPTSCSWSLDLSFIKSKSGSGRHRAGSARDANPDVKQHRHITLRTHTNDERSFSKENINNNNKQWTYSPPILQQK